MDEIEKQAHDITMLYLTNYFQCDPNEAVPDILIGLIQEYKRAYDFVCEQLQ